MSIEAAFDALDNWVTRRDDGGNAPIIYGVDEVIAAFAGDRVLLYRELCKHGNMYRHREKSNRDCSECGGKGRVTGHSGSDAYTNDCFCVTTCRGGRYVQVYPGKDENGAKK